MDSTCIRFVYIGKEMGENLCIQPIQKKKKVNPINALVMTVNFPVHVALQNIDMAHLHFSADKLLEHLEHNEDGPAHQTAD